MLKDLQGSLSKHHIAVTPGNVDQAQIIRDNDKQLKLSAKDIGRSKEEKEQKNLQTREIRDTDAACNIVSHIFRSIDMCLKEDKSKVKLNLFAKSFIKGILTSSVKTGIDDFIRNMDDREIRSLLDDIQHELNKRK